MRINEAVGEHMITQLLQLCKNHLQIEKLPDIKLVDTPSVGSDHSFGVFDGGIKVVSKDRHPVDVMRTLAHELVHWKQRLSGQEMDGNTGSDTENEANAVAGVIMREFGRMHPEYFLV
jgi:hypothetical protein